MKIGKSSSIPPDFQTGFIASLRTAAEMHGVSLEDMLANAQVCHGCTVGTNALVEHKTARVGLLASRGHTDTIFIMKAGNRLKSMPANYIAHVAKQTKPEPLVPKSLCEGIDERVTFDGQVFAALNEETARASIRRLVDQGVEAIAISLVWSAANDTHEKRLRELGQEIAPDMFVSISSEVRPRVGEGGDVTLNVSPDTIRKQPIIVGSWTVNSADMADCVRFIADHGVEVDDLFTDS